jgi:hypothetical protein
VGTLLRSNDLVLFFASDPMLRIVSVTHWVLTTLVYKDSRYFIGLLLFESLKVVSRYPI